MFLAEVLNCFFKQSKMVLIYFSYLVIQKYYSDESINFIDIELVYLMI